MSQLGIAYMPGTFPTKTVLDVIKTGMPEDRYDWTRQKVNDMYWLYKEAILKHGYPVVVPGNFQVKKFLTENSNYTDVDIRVFLSILYQLAQKGEIDVKYWNIPLQKEKKIFRPPEDWGGIGKWSGTLKWVSAAIIVGGAYFLLSPILKSRRR